MFNINNLLRENIKNLTPYSSARDEYQGEASVFLDANENAFGSPLEQQYNRYPDPLQYEVKKRLSEIKGSIGCRTTISFLDKRFNPVHSCAPPEYA